MHFLRTTLLLTITFSSWFASAEQLTEFGLGLTGEQMTQQGFRSKIRDDYQVFELKDDSSRQKVIAAKNDYVAYLKTTASAGSVSYTKLDQSGKVLNQTHCLREANASLRYSCTTVSHNYCHTLFNKMDKGVFAKVKECSSILNSIPYNSQEISTAQKNALKVFESSFATTASIYKSQIPETINSLEQLLNDFASCSALKDKLAPADKADSAAKSSVKESAAVK
ncbi:MAG: hypothetical protein J7501_07745 [Bdellovibrio sp.]|nr:hypothetical protein [Bdellovibrio sp.]